MATRKGNQQLVAIEAGKLILTGHIARPVATARPIKGRLKRGNPTG